MKIIYFLLFALITAFFILSFYFLLHNLDRGHSLTRMMVWLMAMFISAVMLVYIVIKFSKLPAVSS